MTILSSLDFDSDSTGEQPTAPSGWTNNGSGRTWTVESAAAIHGANGLRLATGTSGFRRMEWSETPGSAARVIRIYITPTNLIGANTYILFAEDGSGGEIGTVRINADNSLSIRNGTIAVDTSTGVTFANDTTYRLEWRVEPTVGQELRIYEGESTVPLDTLTGAFSASVLGELHGGLIAAASGFTADYDSFAISDDWIGPVEPPNIGPTAAFTFEVDDLTVSVDASGSTDSDGTIASYSWAWGDGTADGSGETAEHTYASADTYTITLTVTDDDGAEDTATDDVTVTAPASGTAGNPGDPLTYSLNRLAGTLDANGVPTLEAQGAANKWAGTTGLALVGALNVKAGNTLAGGYKELQGVLNQLAGTTGLGVDAAAAAIES